MTRKSHLIVGLISVLALAVSGCSAEKESDQSDNSLTTDEMAQALQTVIALGAATPESSVDLGACPLGDFDALVGKAPAEVQALAAPDDELFAYVYQAVGEPSHLQCGRGELGAYTGEVPTGDYRDDLVGLLDDFILTFESDEAHRGGTLVRFCAEPIGAGGGEFCEADWYDDNVWIGVFISGDGRSSASAQQWLTAILTDVVAAVPQLASSMQAVD